jgi:hypothetical protein
VVTDFTTVFEISADGLGAPILIGPAGVALLIIGLALLSLRIKARGRYPQKSFLERYYLPGFLAVFGLGLLSAYPSYLVSRNRAQALVSAYEHGKYSVTEGVVHVQHEQPADGHAPGDVILVGAKRFEIDFFRDTRGYRQTIARGGALKEGAYVRVYHYRGQIVRVDLEAQGRSDPPISPGALQRQNDQKLQVDGIAVTWKDQIWIGLVSASVILFFVRKTLLARYGYGIGIMDYGMDARRFATIARSASSTAKRRIFRVINVLIPLLFLGAILILLLVRVVLGPV